MAPPLIQLTDISLTFGGTPLLDRAELSVAPGERVCLVGRNGSGKSTLLRIAAGLIDFDRVREDLRGRGIELRGGAADEAPDAYKRLDEVLADHGDTIRVLHRLTPIGVAMAGPDTFDPYKD
jgi:tRNA-splicing ligase RtcB